MKEVSSLFHLVTRPDYDMVMKGGHTLTSCNLGLPRVRRGSNRPCSKLETHTGAHILAVNLFTLYVISLNDCSTSCPRTLILSFSRESLHCYVRFSSGVRYVLVSYSRAP